MLKSERKALLQKELVQRELARRSFPEYMHYIHPELSMDQFHLAYYRILDAFAHGKIRRLIITCPPQSGKAMDVNTPVLTTKGWKRHGALEEGDYVFGEDGLPKKVLHNFGTMLWHSQKISFAGGVSFVTAREHEWEMYFENDTHKDGKHIYKHIRKRVETQQIGAGNYRRSPYVYADAVLKMPKTELPVDPYLLGLWLGDGRKDQGKITCGKEDIEHYRQLPYPCKIKYEEGNGCYTVLFDGLSHELRMLGVLNDKHIPMQYLLAAEEDRWALLQGLMDTDGCVDKEFGRCEFCQKQGQLAEDVYTLIRTLGIKAGKKYCRSTLYGKDCGIRVRILFNPDKRQRIFRMERKQTRLENKTRADRDDKKKFFLDSVEDVPDCLVNCIQVEGGMYLAGYDLVPTHNSEGSTRNLPAYLHGLNPNLQICIASYGFPLAEKFNRAIKANMSTPEYANLFPKTILPKSAQANKLPRSVTSVYANNARNYNLVGAKGGLIATGRGGALTGNPVDIGIIDDLYKDDAEANSPLVRAAAWEWYVDVFSTRLHNNSQQLITFTRWHEDDLIGRLREKCAKEDIPFIELTDFDQLEHTNPKAWYFINFEAIQDKDSTEIDPRARGQVLWPERHSLEKMLEQRKLDPGRFQSLYQGNPMPREGLLYTQGFKTYTAEEFKTDKKSSRGMFLYCDIAEGGGDWLCSGAFNWTRDNKLLFKDIVYSKEGVEITEKMVADQIINNKVRTAWFESNNGGIYFARNVQKILKEKDYHCYVFPIKQTSNKETRIITNAANVQRYCKFPEDWSADFPEFFRDTVSYKRLFKANPHDDAPDMLTGACEYTILGKNSESLYSY